VVDAILAIIFLLSAEKKRKCVLFTAKVNAVIVELFASAPTAYVVIRSCRTFEKHCCNVTQYKRVDSTFERIVQDMIVRNPQIHVTDV
jgi:hypothetical protein